MAAELNEEPLDPQVEMIRRRMMRLLMVSSGIMVIGLMAVLAAIVYKINEDTSALDPAPVAEGVIEMPAGSDVISSSLSRDQIMLTLKLADGSQVIRIHKLNGALVSELKLQTEK